jgi:hypothetical protein
LCLHWLPVFQHHRACSLSEPTATASLTELPVLCSVTHLYSRGTWLRLLLRHSRNTSRDVYRAAAARASAILFAASHSTVAWLPSNCCKQTPYCLQLARHTTLTLIKLVNYPVLQGGIYDDLRPVLIVCVMYLYIKHVTLDGTIDYFRRTLLKVRHNLVDVLVGSISSLVFQWSFYRRFPHKVSCFHRS